MFNPVKKILGDKGSRNMSLANWKTARQYIKRNKLEDREDKKYMVRDYGKMNEQGERFLSVKFYNPKTSAWGETSPIKLDAEHHNVLSNLADEVTVTPSGATRYRFKLAPGESKQRR